MNILVDISNQALLGFLINTVIERERQCAALLVDQAKETYEREIQILMEIIRRLEPINIEDVC